MLAVDAQFPELVPRYLAAIRTIGGQDIDFAINTHWHYDHADGNLVLGPTGTWIVAQANSRAMLTEGQRDQYRRAARVPAEGVSRRGAARRDVHGSHAAQLQRRGDRPDPSGPAHTTGDAAVIFRNHNAVHFGDVFNNAGYPFIDTDNGGDLDGTIAFCEAVLKELQPGATVIPGHGAVAKYDDLVAYIEMLKGVRAKLVGVDPERRDARAGDRREADGGVGRALRRPDAHRQSRLRGLVAAAGGPAAPLTDRRDDEPRPA